MSSSRSNRVSVGIIGDFEPTSVTHIATNEALKHAASALRVGVDATWLPTAEIGSAVEATLGPFDGLWCAPGSPYRSMAGALAGIQFARERRLPFLGTCGGFQHALLEYARNVLGMEAQHEEIDPEASTLLIARLSCAVAGQTRVVRIMPDTLAAKAYGRSESPEEFRCSFGLNPTYRERIAAGFDVSGIDENGEARIAELMDHPFFVATLFVPQVSSTPDVPHPLVVAYLRAIRSRFAGEGNG